MLVTPTLSDEVYPIPTSPSVSPTRQVAAPGIISVPALTADAASAPGDVHDDAAEDSDTDSVPGLQTVYDSSNNGNESGASTSLPRTNPTASRVPLTTEERNAIVRLLLSDRASTRVLGGLPLRFVRDVLDGRVNIPGAWSAGWADDKGGYALSTLR